MARGRGLLLVGAALSLILLGARGVEAPKGKQPPAAKPDDLPIRVNAAIDRGVAWLLSRQTEDGAFAKGEKESGKTALALFTLRSCGVPRDQPGIVRGFSWLGRDSSTGGTRGAVYGDTYSASLVLLALESDRRAPTGGESPGNRDGIGPAPPAAVPDADLRWMEELANFLVTAQVRSGGFGYGPAQARGPKEAPSSPEYDEDHSNTQYALLGLDAARRSGITVPSSVWLKALRHLLECQEPDGPPMARDPPPSGKRGRGGKESVSTVRDRARGWGYMDGASATGSMTTGGISSMAICRSALSGAKEFDASLQAKSEQALYDGLAWLGRNFAVGFNPHCIGNWHYYYLYGLERSGVLAGVESMGGHAWYAEGASYLLGEQAKDGSWGARCGPPPNPGPNPQFNPLLVGKDDFLDTCFALLFLKRATEGAITTTGAAEVLDLSGAASLDPKSFADLLDAVFRRFAMADEAVRAKRAADFVTLGTGSIPLLLRKLEDEGAAVRGAAIDALRRTTGLTHGFDPATSADARTAAIAAWEAWWIGRKGALVADAGAGVFR